MDTYDKTPGSEERYPVLFRVYGIGGLIAGGLQIVEFALALLVIFFGELDLSTIEGNESVTLVIGLVALALSLALSVLFVVLGVRLLKGERRHVALTASVMIALEALVMVCHFMLTGRLRDLIAPGVNTLILIALQTYSDPTLLAERQQHLLEQELEWKAEAEEGTLGRDKTGEGYIALNFFNIFWVFVICCVLGLLVELVYHMTVIDPGVYQDRAGLLYGPFSPIYGIGAVLMTTALNRFYDKNPLLIFVVSAIIGGAFEFFVSWFMQTAFGIVAWDYSGTFLNIDGRTNFKFMCMWGVLGLVWVRYALPVMLKLVNTIPWNWRYAVTSVCTLLMAVDCVLTLASFDCWFQRTAGTMDYENASAIVRFCNANYDDAYMQNRFQTMTMNPEDAARAR